MQLYIIRHAQSANNALADQRERVCDPLLTGLGWRQSEMLAQHLSNGASRAPGTNPANGDGYGVTRLLCSPMRRSLQTAQIVAPALGLKPEVWIDIHEFGGMWLDHGDGQGIVGYPGITRAELEVEFPGFTVPDALDDAGWWRAAGHEELHACLERAARVAETLRSWADADDRIALITHGGFINFLLNTLFRVALLPPVSYFHYNAAVSLITFHPEGKLRIRYLNRLDHLAPDMISE